MTVEHPIPPLFDAQSKVLILGSFPSVKSREQAFFYGHPQNRFWRVIAAVFGEEVPQTVPEKKRLILSHHLALWDVIARCEISGSSDASIQHAVPNDIGMILRQCDIRAVFLNGKTAEKIYRRTLEKPLGFTATVLPSTSPANAACGLEDLIARWSVIQQYC